MDATDQLPFGSTNEFPNGAPQTGHLRAIALEPGEYELYNWILYIQVLGGYGYISPSLLPPLLPFTVTAGKVTYLGHLYIETLMGKNIFGLSIPAGGRPEINDRDGEDVALMVNKFPVFATRPIENAMFDGKTWEKTR